MGCMSEKKSIKTMGYVGENSFFLHETSSFYDVDNIIGGSQNHLNGCFCLFVPQFWEGDGDLRMVFGQSAGAVLVVRTIIGCGDTQTAVIKFV